MKSCQQCGTDFEITDQDRAFYSKIDVLEPRLCPDCRQQRRLAFRNERNLHKRACDFCKKQMVTIYSSDKPYTVYCSECWWGDKWDPMEYGRNFDFNRPFFSQFKELWDEVPKIGLIILGDCINSDYVHDAYRLKNCHLVFDGEQAEDCMYGETFAKIKNCMDFLFLWDNELCYECINCINCFDLKFSRFCKTCTESAFLVDCIGCKNCIGCVNLHQKQHHIFNIPYSPEEYTKKAGEFDLHHYSKIQDFKKEFEVFCARQVKRAFRGAMNQNTSGDNLNGCQNSFEIYDSAGDIRDSKFCTNMYKKVNDCYDLNIWGDSTELCYNSAGVGVGLKNVVGSYYVAFQAVDVYHSIFSWQNVHDLLGCVSLRQKHHCILNKQYSEDEYKNIFSQIKNHMLQMEEWGEFFPPELSAFGYNETVAQEYFPLTKEEVLQKGWKWYDEPEPDFSDVTKKIPAAKLPDTIDKIPDDILNWAIECEESRKLFRIQKSELEFYRKQKFPIPHFHPDIRHVHRQALRNPRKLWKRKCNKCNKEIQTTYAPERPEKMYCEKCYMAEVF